MSKPTRRKKGNPKTKSGRGGPPTRGYVTQYVNRWGHLMRVKDYGYKARKFGWATKK